MYFIYLFICLCIKGVIQLVYGLIQHMTEVSDYPYLVAGALRK